MLQEMMRWVRLRFQARHKAGKNGIRKQKECTGEDGTGKGAG